MPKGITVQQYGCHRLFHVHLLSVKELLIEEALSISPSVTSNGPLWLANCRKFCKYEAWRLCVVWAMVFPSPPRTLHGWRRGRRRCVFDAGGPRAGFFCNRDRRVPLGSSSLVIPSPSVLCGSIAFQLRVRVAVRHFRRRHNLRRWKRGSRFRTALRTEASC